MRDIHDYMSIWKRMATQLGLKDRGEKNRFFEKKLREYGFIKEANHMKEVYEKAI